MSLGEAASKKKKTSIDIESTVHFKLFLKKLGKLTQTAIATSNSIFD
jgi:hypothetical protein